MPAEERRGRRLRRGRPRVLSRLAAWILGLHAGAGMAAAQPAEVWFDDLAGAEALSAAAEEELVRRLSAWAFDPERDLGALPDELEGDREPRMFFLTLGDGVGRARVVRASGWGVAEAAGRLRASVRKLAAAGFTARAVRVDRVSEVRRELAGAGRESPLERSLWGLALDRGLGLAFLPDEVVADTLINSDQRLRLKNVVKRPEAAGHRDTLERLRKSPAVPVYRFATAAHFSGGGPPVALLRGHRTFSRLTPDELLRHAELAGRYLVRSLGEDGRFVYAYLPKTGVAKEKYNALRHCGTAYAMLELYEVTGDPQLLAAAERALGYLERELVGRCEVAGVETACVVEDGAVKLGGNALAIIALAKHAAVTGERRHLPLIDDLGRWILHNQEDDGEFAVHKQALPEDTEEGEVFDFVSEYYPGEALLALLRRPEPDPAWLDAAERGARWLIEIRDRGLPQSALAHDHWLLYSLGELHRRRPDPAWLDHAERITGAILALQRRSSPPESDWLGSYYTPPRSTPVATRSEGLGAAYRMLRDAGRAEQAAALLDALELGVAFQLQTQFLPETVLYLDDPARALGGFHKSLTDYEIRIDYVQHNLSSLLLLRRILLETSRN